MPSSRLNLDRLRGLDRARQEHVWPYSEAGVRSLRVVEKLIFKISSHLPGIVSKTSFRKVKPFPDFTLISESRRSTAATVHLGPFLDALRFRLNAYTYLASPPCICCMPLYR